MGVDKFTSSSHANVYEFAPESLQSSDSKQSKRKKKVIDYDVSPNPGMN